MKSDFRLKYFNLKVLGSVLHAALLPTCESTRNDANNPALVTVSCALFLGDVSKPLTLIALL
jgi:hypothetical protein